MDRLTEYHSDKAVIKDKNLLPQAMEKLAEYEELEERNCVIRWHPADELPSDGRSILLSFADGSLAGEGSYSEELEGGKYFYGDDTSSCTVHGHPVNAWAEMPMSVKDELATERQSKIKVSSLDIIVNTRMGKPYYEIKYKKIGERAYNIGYSSYSLGIVRGYKEKYFEVIDSEGLIETTGYTEEEEENFGKWISVDERLPEDFDGRFYMCLVENNLENTPMFCQYDEEYGFGFWRDTYSPITYGFLDTEFETMEELGYEKVLYWMPMIEPPVEGGNE